MGRAAARTRRRSSARAATAPSPSSTPTPTAWCGPCAVGDWARATPSPLACRNRAEFAEAVYAACRAAAAAHHRQLAPHRRRGRLHRRQLRGQGHRRRRRPSPTWPLRPWPTPRTAPCGSRSAAPSTASSATTPRSAVEDGADIDDPPRGSSMLYTSGTTGRPKGVHRAVKPGAGAAPVLNIYGYDDAGGDVHLCTGPLYHAAPLRLLAERPACVRRHRRADGGVGRRGDPAADRRARHHPHPHGADHVPPPAVAAARGARRRPTASPAPRAARRRALPGAGEATADRVARARSCVEYYAATEGVGSFVDSATWLTRPGTVGRPIASRPGHDRRRGRPAAALRTRSGSSTSSRRRAPRSTTSTTPTRPTAPTGATTSRWATSATSTRTASCSSPTAPPTSSSRAA